MFCSIHLFSPSPQALGFYEIEVLSTNHWGEKGKEGFTPDFTLKQHS